MRKYEHAILAKPFQIFFCFLSFRVGLYCVRILFLSAWLDQEKRKKDYYTRVPDRRIILHSQDCTEQSSRKEKSELFFISQTKVCILIPLSIRYISVMLDALRLKIECQLIFL